MTDSEPLSLIDHRQSGSIYLNSIRPLNGALAVACSYLAVGIIYIQYSDSLAARLAFGSVERMASIARLKGTVYVIVTAILLFATLYWLLRRIQADQVRLRDYRDVLLAAERRAAAGLFASSVAHDIGNILMISDYAAQELAESSGLTPMQRRRVEELTQASDQLQALARRLSQASGRHLTDKVTQFDLMEIIRATADLARSHRSTVGCEITFEGPAALPFWGNASLVHQMLLNLFLNAGQAAGRRGRILVRVVACGERVSLEVHDNGPGIPAPARTKVFEPFYTSKADGSGLGLLSVQACAQAHRGTVTILDSILGGACFRIELSLTRPRDETKDEKPVVEHVGGRVVRSD